MCCEGMESAAYNEQEHDMVRIALSAYGNLPNNAALRGFHTAGRQGEARNLDAAESAAAAAAK
jgi:hypothetical protein